MTPPLALKPRRSAEHGHRQKRHESAIGIGEIPGDTTEQHRVGDSVGDRVEEGAARTSSAGCLRYGAIKGVGQTSEDKKEKPQGQESRRDGNCSARRHDHAKSSQAIGGETQFEQVRSNRLQRFLDIGSPTTVKHGERLAVGH
jgi:hypothetical protein